MTDSAVTLYETLPGLLDRGLNSGSSARARVRWLFYATVSEHGGSLHKDSIFLRLRG
jgi:hypothetical protein